MLLALETPEGLATPAARTIGATVAYVTEPDGTTHGHPFQVIDYQVDRYANRIGAWRIVIPVSGPLMNGIPLARSIVTGWKVSILQEWNNPFGAGTTRLLTDGQVQRREYRLAGDELALELSGPTKNYDLVREEFHDPEEFGSYGDNVALKTIADSIAGRSISVIGGEGKTLAITYNEGSRFAGLLKLGEYARMTLRETWDGDALEFVPVDGAPWSGITLINIEQAGPEMVG